MALSYSFAARASTLNRDVAPVRLRFIYHLPQHCVANQPGWTMSGDRRRTIVPIRVQTLANSTQPPDPPDMMEARVARLGDDMKEVRAGLKLAIKDLAYLRGRIEHLPTTWILVTSIAASQAALLGFTFTMLRFFSPHL
jgi:hypothetical protein